jgi:hypothetical protein
MDFSSLVLMERDSESNLLTKEIGSYEVNEGAEYITKLYCLNGEVSVYFDTKEDVEEWEYSAIYDLFNEEAFTEKNYIIEFDEEEYNPTWIIKFPYVNEYEEMKDKLNEICTLIETEMKAAFEASKGKKEQYE